MLTNAELAVLGLVVEKPRHGYAIEGVIEERGMRNWTEVGFSSIYYILNKLEEQGLVESQLVDAEGQGPARKVYQVTAAGRRTWTAGTLQALSVPGRPNSSFLLGLSGLPGVDTQEALSALRRYRGALGEVQLGLRKRLEDLDPKDAPLFLIGMFDYSLRLATCEAAWLDEFIDKLASE